ncbi:hypothetical protein AABB24_023581 [Solanum stoloniferum]|uniref:B3 domain-containing protein n=1 Tax=Solanum stoloniferum TaxID=62892 RepID=A0ABD2SK96_9SOLN
MLKKMKLLERIRLCVNIPLITTTIFCPGLKEADFFRRKNPPTVIQSQSTSQKKGLKFRISLKRKTIETFDGDLSMERTKTETLFDEKTEQVGIQRRKIKPIIDPPVLPDELKEKISGMGVQISEVKFVIQKVLYDTDLSYKHMRMSIPVNQVERKDFLTSQQKMVLETRDIESNKKSKIQFNLIEPSLEETKIHLAKWDMSNNSSYVLLNDWMEVVERNKLKFGMVVQLWSFHQHLVPWLALVSVRQ